MAYIGPNSLNPKLRVTTLHTIMISISASALKSSWDVWLHSIMGGSVENSEIQNYDERICLRTYFNLKIVIISFCIFTVVS